MVFAIRYRNNKEEINKVDSLWYFGNEGWLNTINRESKIVVCRNINRSLLCCLTMKTNIP